MCTLQSNIDCLKVKIESKDIGKMNKEDSFTNQGIFGFYLKVVSNFTLLSELILSMEKYSIYLFYSKRSKILHLLCIA